MSTVIINNIKSFDEIRNQIHPGANVVLKDFRRGIVASNNFILDFDGGVESLLVVNLFDEFNCQFKAREIDHIVVNTDYYKTIEEIESIVDKAAKEVKLAGGITKPKFSLIPQHALLEVARVFTFGEDKYKAYNYSKGEDATVYVDAAMRHINKYLMQEDIDDETKTHHLANAVADLLMTLDNILIGKSNDNRNEHYKKIIQEDKAGDVKKTDNGYCDCQHNCGRCV